MLTVNRLGLPTQLRRSLACTNSIENMMGTVRRVCRNVKRWRNADMALRWTTAGMMEATKGFRRLKAHKQLPILKAALAAHQAKHAVNPDLEQQAKAGAGARAVCSRLRARGLARRRLQTSGTPAEGDAGDRRSHRRVARGVV